MISAVIIDDETRSVKSLRDDIVLYCPEIDIIGEADDVKSGVELVRTVNPKLLFLDIQMPDGTGFDLLKRLIILKGGVDKLDFQVIFTTAHEQYAIKAIKFSALDYLMKPIDPDELVEAVKKIKDKNKIASSHIDTLLENITHSGLSKKIALNTAESILVYNIDEIIRCESQRNYTQFFFKTGKPVLVSTTLGVYDNLLKEHEFIRVHHSHLINLSHLKKFVKTDGGYAIMTDDSNVPVAQRKRDHLLKLLSSL